MARRSKHEVRMARRSTLRGVDLTSPVVLGVAAVVVAGGFLLLSRNASAASPATATPGAGAGSGGAAPPPPPPTGGKTPAEKAAEDKKLAAQADALFGAALTAGVGIVEAAAASGSAGTAAVAIAPYMGHASVAVSTAWSRLRPADKANAFRGKATK